MKGKYLAGKTVLITGASMGIGRSLAERFAQEGANLILTARSEEFLRNLCESLAHYPQEIVYEVCDLCDPESLEALTAKLARRHRLDGVIHNAGAGLLGDCENLPPEQVRHLFQLNFFSVVQLTQALLPLLRQADAGRIVFVSSVVSWRAIPGFGAYCASKAALNAFAEATRIECDSDDVKVVNIYPSRTKTRFLKNAPSYQPSAHFEKYQGQSPEYVAEKIFQAYRKGKRDEFVTWRNRAVIHLNFYFPQLVDWTLRKFARRNEKPRA